MLTTLNVLDAISGSLVVSCQAAPGTPLAQPSIIAALAMAAETGGAAGLRIEGIDDILAVKAVSRLPIIGLVKSVYPGSDVYITPTAKEVTELVAAGVEVLAIDATARPRPAGTFADLVHLVRDTSDALVMADVATLSEGLAALELGVDLVGTTLQGYTDAAPPTDGPAFDLMARLVDAGARVVAEGRVWTPEDVERCYKIGVHSIVVGGAVTDPIRITERLVRATPGIMRGGAW